MNKKEALLRATAARRSYLWKVGATAAHSICSSVRFGLVFFLVLFSSLHSPSVFAFVQFSTNAAATATATTITTM